MMKLFIKLMEKDSRDNGPTLNQLPGRVLREEIRFKYLPVMNRSPCISKSYSDKKYYVLVKPKIVN